MKSLTVLQELQSISVDSKKQQESSDKKQYMVYCIEDIKLGVPLDKVDDFDLFLETANDFDIEDILKKFEAILV
jgi:hypothetical protein